MTNKNLISVAIAICLNVFAADAFASVDAGVGGSIIQGLILIFVIWPATLGTVVFFSRKAPGWLRVLLPVLVVVLPPFIYKQMAASEEAASVERHAQYIATTDSNFLKYKESCNTGSLNVDTTLPPSKLGDYGVSIHFSKRWSRTFQIQLLGTIQYCFFDSDKKSSCVKSSVSYFEADTIVDPFKPNELLRLEVKPVGFSKEKINSIEAPYRLELGNLDETHLRPRTAIQRLPVRLLRKSDGKVLGSVDVVFLHDSSGVFSCPKAEEEISKLLGAVFVRK